MPDTDFAKPGCFADLITMQERPAFWSGRMKSNGTPAHSEPPHGGYAALARREEILHREDVALCVHDADEFRRRDELGVEPEPREALALWRDEAVVHEVAVLDERALGGLPAYDVGHAAVRPCRAREVDDHREPRAPVFPGDLPFDGIARLVAAPWIAVLAEPCGRHLGAGRVESEPLEVCAVGKALVYPRVFVGIPWPADELAPAVVCVVQVPDKKARLPVYRKFPSGAIPKDAPRGIMSDRSPEDRGRPAGASFL